MIAVDTSALVAIAFGEPEEDELLGFVLQERCIVGVPTALDAGIVIDGRGTPSAREVFEEILSRSNVDLIPFEITHALIAREAFARYGKGRGHPAQLNFGDCMAYAVAKRDGLPLLYKGDDFARTDLRPARVVA